MSTSHNILIVEDDADDRYLMHMAFTELDYADHVKVFNSGEDLLRYLTNLPHASLYPSLIVLDYNMPGMNGGEVLMRLKLSGPFREIPVALYTASINGMDARFKGMGADHCLEKGNRISDMYSLAERIKLIVEKPEAGISNLITEE